MSQIRIFTKYFNTPRLEKDPNTVKDINTVYPVEGLPNFYSERQGLKRGLILDSKTSDNRVLYYLNPEISEELVAVRCFDTVIYETMKIFGLYHNMFGPNQTDRSINDTIKTLRESQLSTDSEWTSFYDNLLKLQKTNAKV